MHSYFLSVFVVIIAVLSVATVCKANSYNNNTNRDYHYQAGPIIDPNDSTHVKAQQQAAQDRWISNVCDKGHGNPLCYNVGYYSGVAEANNHNSYHGMILYSLVCPQPNTANYCAGYIQGYSHTYAGHIPNASEVWNAGYNISYFNGVNVNFNYPNPILNGTNPASCTEGPPAYCDGYAQGYPHGIETALGNELGTKAADHDWKVYGTIKNIPACPPMHTVDWCTGFQSGYGDEWNILSDTD
jgi:hypothetical protein